MTLTQAAAVVSPQPLVTDPGQVKILDLQLIRYHHILLTGVRIITAALLSSHTIPIIIALIARAACRHHLQDVSGLLDCPGYEVTDQSAAPETLGDVKTQLSDGLRHIDHAGHILVSCHIPLLQTLVVSRANIDAVVPRFANVVPRFVDNCHHKAEVTT